MSKKIKQTHQTPPQGMSEVVHTMMKISEIADDAPVPAGAMVLPEDDTTPVTDGWVHTQEGN